MSTGKLTTHVLDTAKGRPAAQITVEIWQLSQHPETRTLLTMAKTNANGRTDEPLLQGEDFNVGIYELIFAVGDYFAATEDNLPNPQFLDRVPIRVGIANTQAHYHVPLLVSPWAYSTYRGS
ncbi:MAG: hydroxyisourate hydrolase [Cyanobacteria bacterium J06635_15]